MVLDDARLQSAGRARRLQWRDQARINGGLNGIEDRLSYTQRYWGRHENCHNFGADCADTGLSRSAH